jgi:nitrate/nitrite-specific signal transduction histidine kinase
MPAEGSASRSTPSAQSASGRQEWLRASAATELAEDRAEQQVRARLLEVVNAATPAPGFGPALRFSGVLENVLPEPMVEDLLAVLAEALSSVARHARAHNVTVSAATSADRLTLDVTDDGVGIGSTTCCGGLTSLRQRTEHLQGVLSLTPNRPTGTHLSWVVPI